MGIGYHETSSLLNLFQFNDSLNLFQFNDSTFVICKCKRNNVFELKRIEFWNISRKTLVLNLFQKSGGSLSVWYQKIYDIYIYAYCFTYMYSINYVYIYIKAYTSGLHVTAIKLWSPCPRQSKVDCFGSIVPIKFNKFYLPKWNNFSPT